MSAENGNFPDPSETQRHFEELIEWAKGFDYATGGVVPGDPCTCPPTRESVMTPDGHVRCAYVTFHEPGCPSRIESTTTYIRRGSPL